MSNFRKLPTASSCPDVDWFKDLPFDEEGMEEAVLDKKIKNVLGVMGWDLSRANDSKVMDAFFEF